MGRDPSKKRTKRALAELFLGTLLSHVSFPVPFASRWYPKPTDTFWQRRQLSVVPRSRASVSRHSSTRLWPYPSGTKPTHLGHDAGRIPVGVAGCRVALRFVCHSVNTWWSREPRKSGTTAGELRCTNPTSVRADAGCLTEAGQGDRPSGGGTTSWVSVASSLSLFSPLAHLVGGGRCNERDLHLHTTPRLPRRPQGLGPLLGWPPALLLTPPPPLLPPFFSRRAQGLRRNRCRNAATWKAGIVDSRSRDE